MGGNLLTVQSLTHTHSNDDIFHGSDKMPKHVEMVRTKCQPKIGTDKMPTTIKSQFVWLAFGRTPRFPYVKVFHMPSKSGGNVKLDFGNIQTSYC